MENQGAQVELKSGARGAFEVVIGGRRVFSKLETGRFPTTDEILPLLGTDRKRK